MWGWVVPGRVLEGVAINFSGVKCCQWNGWLVVLSLWKFLITTSPGKVWEEFGKNVIKFYATEGFLLLYVMIVCALPYGISENINKIWS